MTETQTEHTKIFDYLKSRALGYGLKIAGIVGMVYAVKNNDLTVLLPSIVTYGSGEFITECPHMRESITRKLRDLDTTELTDRIGE